MQAIDRTVLASLSWTSSERMGNALDRHVDEGGLAHMVAIFTLHTFADEGRDLLAGLHQIPVVLGEVF